MVKQHHQDGQEQQEPSIYPLTTDSVSLNNDNTHIIHDRSGIRAAHDRIRIRHFHHDRTALHAALLRRGHYPFGTACLGDIVDNNGEIQERNCMEQAAANIGNIPSDEFHRHTDTDMDEKRHAEVCTWHHTD